MFLLQEAGGGGHKVDAIASGPVLYPPLLGPTEWVMEHGKDAPGDSGWSLLSCPARTHAFACTFPHWGGLFRLLLPWIGSANNPAFWLTGAVLSHYNCTVPCGACRVCEKKKMFHCTGQVLPLTRGGIWGCV